MGFDFKGRQEGLQQRMEENGIDLAVYGSCQNFQYLTGLLVEWRRGIDLNSAVSNVFVPRQGQPVLTLPEGLSEHSSETWIKDVRTVKAGESYGKLIANIIHDLCPGTAKVGLGDHVWGSTTAEIAKTLRNVRFCAAEALMDQVRMIKDPAEIERLEKVAQLTDKAIERILPEIKQGATQHELQLAVEQQGRLLGASDVSFPPTVGFVRSGSKIGPNPFTYPKDEGLKPRTSVALDVGFVMNGYCSDFGRSFYFGRASREVIRGYEALQQSVLETVDKMHDGSMRVCDLFPALERTLDRLGYGDYLRARLKTDNLGHNIGVEVHEPPWLSPEYNEVLQKNMVIAIEPKLWHAGEYYLRVEDILLVGSRKTRFLTNFDRELFQL
jgi:Xaa-Pro aminopeptidase